MNEFDKTKKKKKRNEKKFNFKLILNSTTKMY